MRSNKKKQLNNKQGKESEDKDYSLIKEESKKKKKSELKKQKDKNKILNESENKNNEIIRSGQERSSNKLIESDADDDKKGLSNKNEIKEEKNHTPSDKEESKIQKRKPSLGLGLIISVIAVIIIFVVSQIITEKPQEDLNETFVPDSYIYNGFVFQKGSDAWYSSMILGNNSYNVSFVYGPKEVDYIDVQPEVNDIILNAEEILVTTNPNYSSRVGQAQIEIVKITSPRTSNFGVLNIPTFATVTYLPEDAIGYSEDFPTATCENATENRTVINLILGNDTRIYKEGFCVIVEGETEKKIVEASDRLVYNLLGIIK